MDSSEKVCKHSIEVDKASYAFYQNRVTSNESIKRNYSDYVRNMTDIIFQQSDVGSDLSPIKFDETPEFFKEKLYLEENQTTLGSEKRGESADYKQNHILCSSPILQDRSRSVQSYFLDFSVDIPLASIVDGMSENEKRESTEDSKSGISFGGNLSVNGTTQWWWDSENLSNLGYKTYGQSADRDGIRNSETQPFLFSKSTDTFMSNDDISGSVGSDSKDSMAWSVEHYLSSSPLSQSPKDKPDPDVLSALPTLISQPDPHTSMPLCAASIQSTSIFKPGPHIPTPWCVVPKEAIQQTLVSNPDPHTLKPLYKLSVEPMQTKLISQPEAHLPTPFYITSVGPTEPTLTPKPDPYTSTPLSETSLEPVQSTSLASVSTASSRDPISVTPVRRQDMKFRDLEPLKLTDLYSRARLGGEARDTLDMSVLESDTEDTQLASDSVENVSMNVHEARNALDMSVSESGAEDKKQASDSVESWSTSVQESNVSQILASERECEELHTNPVETSEISNCTDLLNAEHNYLTLSKDAALLNGERHKLALSKYTVSPNTEHHSLAKGKEGRDVCSLVVGNNFKPNDVSAVEERRLPHLNIADDSTPEKAISGVNSEFFIGQVGHVIISDITKQFAVIEADHVTDNAPRYLIEAYNNVESYNQITTSFADSGLSASSASLESNKSDGEDRQNCLFVSDDSLSPPLKPEREENTELKNQSFGGTSSFNEKDTVNPQIHPSPMPEVDKVPKDFDASTDIQAGSDEDETNSGDYDDNTDDHMREKNDDEIFNHINIDTDDDDEVFTGMSSSSASVGSRGSPNNFAVLFRQFRVERDAAGKDDVGVVFSEETSSGFSSTSRDGLLARTTVLCAERVSQMTKTYNDIEAVTRLLEEKERDLELAARIGQTLLSKNKELVSRTEALEEQLAQATERSNQLRHEMGMKDELLRFYNEDLEQDAAGGDTPPTEKPALDVVNVDFLEKKVKSLEDENLHLRLESANLQSATSNYEDKEKKLVEDCIQQLAEVNQQVETFASELQLKSEENLHQKEEIKTFLGQIAGLQTKIRKLTLENMDVHEKFTASTESQRKLTKELGMMQDRYDELMEMLEETQDELQLMKSRQRPRSNANSQQQASAYTVPTDSLASELENSLRQEQLGQAFGQRRAQSWRVFETAKAAKKAAAKTAQSSSSTSRMSISASGDATGPSSICDSSQLSVCTSDIESGTSDGYSGDMDSLYESNSELGRPGIPGSNDLDNALRRLATRRANEMNEKEFLAREAQRNRKFSGSSESSLWSNQTFDASGRDMLDSARDSNRSGSRGGGGASTSGLHSPTGSLSSVWSSATGSAQISGAPPSTLPGQGFKISDRLQIVKPMEGSMTLRHWKHLANPHLGGIFEQREGIQMKGEGTQAGASVGETYSISDFEEDGEPQDIHTRKEQDHSLIYTFTDSTVHSFGPSPYRGLGTLFDSSCEASPHKSSFSTSSIGTDRLAFGTSTPRLASGSAVSAASPPNTTRTDASQAKHPTSYTMSSGLASLLDSKESPIVGRSLLRAASIPKLNLSGSDTSQVSKPRAESNANRFLSLSARSFSTISAASSSNAPMQTTATSTVSALDLNPTWASWANRSMGNLSSFPPHSSSSSALSSSLWKQRLPGSGSFEEPPVSSLEQGENSKPKEEILAVTVSNPNSPRRTAIFTPGMTGQGLLQQLKNKSLSLYGLWSGTNPNPSDNKSSSQGARPRLSSGTNIDAGFEESASVATKLGTTKEEECKVEGAEPSDESILPSDTGVVGAMVNFRRSGIL